MADRIATFWTAPTGLDVVTLRVFTFGEWTRRDDDHEEPENHARCPAQPVRDNGYQDGHDASVVAFDGTPGRAQSEPARWTEDDFPPHHPLWPSACDACDAPVAGHWVRQVNEDPYYAAADGRQWLLRSLPVGAMYDGYWLPRRWRGDDGITLEVVLPNGRGGTTTWSPDSMASNCGARDTPHRCWCRHGDPRTGPVTVDKECDTCTAGAGSIGIGGRDGGYDWHGFLREGFLVEA